MMVFNTSPSYFHNNTFSIFKGLFNEETDPRVKCICLSAFDAFKILRQYQPNTSTTLVYTESTLRKSSEFVVAHLNIVTAMAFSD
jgi:hypothetical protein